jgi:hypothetical protein
MSIPLNKALPILAAVVLGAACCSAISAEEPKPEKSPPTPAWHWPKVVISKETTYFTGPLRPDGGVDYVAALNRRYSEGVTPENNAAVALWQAAGPQCLDKRIRKRYFEMLGVPELAEKGEYLVYFDNLPEYKEASRQPDQWEAFSRKVWGQHTAARESPWSRQDYPLWAAVLERSEKPLAILLDGLQRPRFYSPLVAPGDEPGLIAGFAPTEPLSAARDVMYLLAIRPTLRLHEGDVAGAWRDVVALYRMERLSSRSPILLDRLSIASIAEAHAHEAAAVVSCYGGLTAAQARKCREEMQRLPPMRPLWEVYDEGERCWQIEYLIMFVDTKDARREFGLIESSTSKVLGVENSKHEQRTEAVRRLIAERDMDWTELLRCYNTAHDRLVAACKAPTGVTAAVTLTALEAETRQQADRAADSVLAEGPDALKRWDPKLKAQRFGDLFAYHTAAWLPVMQVCIEQQRQARENMILLAFALAGYRADHPGEYPKTLSELAPTYIDAIPKDPFTDGPLHYKSEDGGYLLYSVGRNGKDDGGSGPLHVPDSATEEQRKAWPSPWDDLSIRTPPKQTENK